MSRIAVIGGHGKVALHLSRILSGRGHRVSSLIRNPDHRADVEATGAEPVVADVESLDAGRLAAIKVELDRAYDLLHQRAARRAAGLDPKDAEPRPAEVVEHYQQ